MKPRCQYCGLGTWTQFDTRLGMTCYPCSRFIEAVSDADAVPARPRHHRIDAVDAWQWQGLRNALDRGDDAPLTDDPFVGLA